MSDGKLRVILLTQGGCELVVEKLMEIESIELCGIFIETDVIRRRGLRERIVRSLRYDGYAATAIKFARSVFGSDLRQNKNQPSLVESREQLKAIANQKVIPFFLVGNFHSQYSLELMHSTNPDLGILLGTNILKESVFTIPRLGSINLHQGLAPYYRGGPSVFWELTNGESELGLTVHYVAPKVDTGDIVLQRTVPLAYNYSYELDYQAFIDDFSRQLKLPCANLVADAVRMIADRTVVSIPQIPGIGKRYRLPTKSQKDELKRRLRQRRAQAAYPVTQKANIGD